VGQESHSIPTVSATVGTSAHRGSRALSTLTVTGIPGWDLAHRRHHSPPVAAVIEVRCWTVKTAGVTAFRAANTGTRGRPEGAVTNSRGPHHPLPKQGAHTPWAASRHQTARGPAPAASNLGARRLFKGCVGVHVGRGREHAAFHRVHPSRASILPHLGRRADEAGQLGDVRRRCRHARRRMRRQGGCARGAMVGQCTGRPIRRDVLQLGAPTRDVGLERAMDTGVGHPTPPPDLGIGHALTASVEGVQPHLSPWGRMLKPPIPPRAAGGLVEDAFDQRPAPQHGLDHQRIPPRRRLEHQVGIKSHLIPCRV
jgi:hypothetical protein